MRKNLFLEYLLTHFSKWNELIDKGVSVYKSCKTAPQQISAQNYLELITKKIVRDASKFIGDSHSYYQVERHVLEIFKRKI